MHACSSKGFRGFKEIDALLTTWLGQFLQEKKPVSTEEEVEEEGGVLTSSPQCIPLGDSDLEMEESKGEEQPLASLCSRLALTGREFDLRAKTTPRAVSSQSHQAQIHPTLLQEATDPHTLVGQLGSPIDTQHTCLGVPEPVGSSRYPERT
ncbi:hypothetical protein NDU88_006837 [Pleurodeles waltl]|uniref:Uncharacterized protein n=1 Tax=Pleurodeles waltl TaxID=8319 RepID=A0AAV7RNM2_PLEWA|nr:hypothetical protein NDU88_006837 [Pleurodeles waltl]